MKIKVECLPEKSNFRSRSFEYDPSVVEYIREELKIGNKWVWCTIRVSIEIAGITVEEFLGGCSYKNKLDFISSDYYLDMINTCIERLKEISEIITKELAN